MTDAMRSAWHRHSPVLTGLFRPYRRVWLLCGIAILCACAPGCGRSAEHPPAAPTAARRVICMAPNITEAVFAIGAGDRVVGVSSYTVYPPEAMSRPRVGALYDANLEKIVALRPDLIIVQQRHPAVEALCQTRGIPLLRVEMTRVGSILDGIRKIGEVLDARERAASVCGEIERRLGAVRERTASLPRRRVFICVDRTAGSLKGMFTVGGESFLTEMVELAGGENVFADVARDYFPVETEAVIARAPEVVIETRPSQRYTPDEERRLIEDWKALPDVPAVRNGKVYVVTDDFIVVPGPRLPLIAERFAEILHGSPGHAR